MLIFANSLSSNFSSVIAPFVMQQQHLVESTPDLYSQFSLNLCHINHFLVFTVTTFDHDFFPVPVQAPNSPAAQIRDVTKFKFEFDNVQTSNIFINMCWISAAPASNRNRSRSNRRTNHPVDDDDTEYNLMRSGLQNNDGSGALPFPCRRYRLCLHWSLFRIRQKPADTDAQKN